MTIGTAIYSGGNPYTPHVPYHGSSTEQLFIDIAEGGYTTVVLWAAHIDGAGDITINDCPVVAGGVFNSEAQPWANQVAALHQTGTITRVELSIGGDQTSFANIKSLINQHGTGSANPLYTNLSLLKTTLMLDAINYDDESEYDTSSSAALAAMCVSLGMKVSICPYMDGSYWVNLVTTINQANPGTADAVYLQCYDGGAENDPRDWNTDFQATGLTVAPGLWATHYVGNPPTCTNSTSASEAQTQIARWAKQTSLDGGWMFCGTDMMNCPGGGSPQDYANAIRVGLGAANG